MAKTFFGGIATILPLFILTSELIAISTSFRCFYTCLTQDLVAANSSKSFVGESGQPSGSQLLFPGWESGLGLESREVSHQNRELTKDLKDPVPGLSAVGGHAEVGPMPEKSQRVPSQVVSVEGAIFKECR